MVDEGNRPVGVKSPRGLIYKAGMPLRLEDAPIHEAIQLMLKRAIKRLPVVHSQGKFQGMISRDALLRAGYASS